MDIEGLREQLNKIGVSVSAKTLRRWGDDGLIPNHRKNLAKTGRGNAEYWSPATVQAAAAVWTLLHYKKGVTMDMVKAVKKWISVQGFGGFATYDIPPVTRSLSGVRKIEYEKITLQLAPLSITMDDGSDGIGYFPGSDKKQRVQLFDELIKKWIGSVAKIWYTREQERLAQETGKPSYNKWPLDQGAIVKVVNRRIAHQRAWLWQFESLEIIGRTEPGEPDTIFIFERADGDEKAVDTRELLVENISRAFGGS